MAKKKLPQASVPVIAFILLGLGVVIAVGGFAILPFLVSEEMAVVVSLVSLVVGIVLAMLGVRQLRAKPKRR